MFDRISKGLRAVRLGLAGLAVATLAACMGGGGPSVDTRAPVTVALLVPYGAEGGRLDGLARGLENAARLALADLQGGAQIDLRIYATAGTAEGATAAATQAAGDGAKILLGPVFAEEAKAAGAAVSGRGLNVLAFSTNPTVAGGNVYILGTSYIETARRVVAYAAEQGRTRLVVVHATNETGEIGLSAARAATTGTAASIVGAASYEFSQKGVVDALATISGTIRDTGADGVIFTSDSSGALPLLSQLLPDNRINPASIKFMGLSRWDLPPQTLTLSGLQGGWFALPDPGLAEAFAARYRGAYGEAPHPVAGLAYDGIAAIGALLGTGQATALTGASLTRGEGFAGVGGVFRLRSDGTTERALAVATIEANTVKVLDPAPRSFRGPGL